MATLHVRSATELRACALQTSSEVRWPMANGMVPVELARAAVLTLSWLLPCARAPLKLMAPAQHRRLLSARQTAPAAIPGSP